MFAVSSAIGFFVHTPCGLRKSGMPEEVEIPAPVSTAIGPGRSRQEPAAGPAAEFVMAPG